MGFGLDDIFGGVGSIFKDVGSGIGSVISPITNTIGSLGNNVENLGGKILCAHADGTLISFGALFLFFRSVP